MRLLFDQNMSPKLPARLCDIFPESAHVQQHHLDKAPDHILWEYARDNEYTIVTKDVDFSERPVLFGFPPKVIWFKRGNCSISDMEVILRRHAVEIHSFLDDSETGLLVIQ